MDLEIDIIDNYFSTINPIARKIHLDITETKSSYEHIWNELNTTEQTDIINETLIKPEIALRYFDSFSSAFSSTTASTASSSICNANNENDESDGDHDLKKLLTDKIQNGIYMYDGKNLKTYNIQKTAQKLIHDDMIGVFRDEHSAPFSFKTKSQINLNLFNNTHTAQSQQAVLKQPIASSIITNSIGSTTPTLSTTTNRTIDNQISNIKYQQQQINSNYNEMTTPKSSMLPALVKNITNTSKKYERFYNDEKLSSKATSLDDNDKFVTTTKTPTDKGIGVNDIKIVVGDDTDEKINFLTKFICKNNLIFNTANQNDATKSNCSAIDDDDDDYENKVLMNSVCYSGELNSSSSIQSEEDDEKHVYEDSKLLLEASSDELRKGFDFLNNW